MRPAVGSTSLSIVLPRVLLPQPDSPTRPSVSPFLIEKLTPSTAWTWPTALPRTPFRTGKSFFRSKVYTIASGSIFNPSESANLVASYEQIVIDDEIVGTIERILAGIDFDADALAIDLIKEVGPGGTYISKRHTLARLKKEHYMSRLSDRKQYSAWIREGSKQMNDRARERARAILKGHAPPPLDKSVDRRVQEIIKKAARNRA